MNFYPFNIGDYAGKTRHLTWDEDMAYRRLLDVYYSTESPLPVEKRQIYRFAGAQTAKQKQAVDTVLEEFFDATPDGFRNERCDAEIAKAAEKAVESDERRDNEKERQRRHRARRKELFEILRTHDVVPPFDAPTKTLEEMVSQRDGHKVVTQPVTRDATANNPNPNPNPNIIDGIGTRARDPGETLEWTLRKAAGWENHPAPKLSVTGPITALLETGADLDLDVLPIVRALAPKVRSPGWTYFVNAIAQARDERISAATIVSPPTAMNGASHAAPRGKPSRSAIFDAIHARIDRAERGAEADGSPEPRDPAQSPT